MGRRRMIDIDLVFEDQEMWDCLGPRGILFYELLWGLATDYGVVELEVTQLAAKSRYLAFTPTEVAAWIRAQVQRRKVLLFRGQDFKTYLHILAFTKHQILNTPGKPTTPLPPWIQCEQIMRGTRKCYGYSIDYKHLPAEYKPIDPLEGVQIFDPLQNIQPEGDSIEKKEEEDGENCTVQHGAARCNSVLHGAARCSDVLHGAARCSTVLHGAASSSVPSSVLGRGLLVTTSSPPQTPPPRFARSGGLNGKEKEKSFPLPASPTPEFNEVLKCFPGAATLKGPALMTAFKAFCHLISNGATSAQIAKATLNYAASRKDSRKPPERLSRWLTSGRYLDFLDGQPTDVKSNWDTIPVQVKKQKS